MQVHEVITGLVPDTAISVALLNGTHTTRDEGALLATGSVPKALPQLLALVPTLQAALPVPVEYHPTAATCLYPEMARFSGAGEGGLQVSAVHIAVVTPGRLVQQMQLQGSAWLRELEFLVRPPALPAVLALPAQVLLRALPAGLALAAGVAARLACCSCTCRWCCCAPCLLFLHFLVPCRSQACFGVQTAL